ncbi:hypothetical protein GDO81_029878 [Engystomops pustulosus]|uniref:Uncharacterized protein n=1 Tax=Engystomops pustulosus TaxID=76066 RepID=A0AAV6ZKS0_ENGPU|nr:hypothetical protein GDO81_029878 [Engystomops pustulosus]
MLRTMVQCHLMFLGRRPQVTHFFMPALHTHESLLIVSRQASSSESGGFVTTRQILKDRLLIYNNAFEKEVTLTALSKMDILEQKEAKGRIYSPQNMTKATTV